MKDLNYCLMCQQRAGAVDVTAVTGNPTELGRLYVEEQTTKFMYALYVKDKLFPQSKFLNWIVLTWNLVMIHIQRVSLWPKN